MLSSRFWSALSWALLACSAILFLDCGRQCVILGLHQVEVATIESRLGKLATNFLECQRSISASNTSIAQSLELIAIANSSQYQDAKQAPEAQQALCQSDLIAGKSKPTVAQLRTFTDVWPATAQQTDFEARLAYLTAKLASADAEHETMRRLVALLRGKR